MSSPPLDSAPAVAAWLGERLEAEGVAYAIGGALALAVWGVPRMTKDVDLSVFVEREHLDRLFDGLERSGCLFDRRRARADVDRMNLFAVRCGRIDVDLFVAFHPHHHESFGRRARIAAPDGAERWFLSAEDLAIHKIALHRPKDMADLEGLFATQRRALDVTYVRRWVEAIAPPGDARRKTLDDLERRFLGDTGG